MTPRRASPPSLATLPGPIALIGAGRMGSAMLDGWLARGLDLRRLIVIEPQPTPSIKALRRRGASINPKLRETDPDRVAALVVAVKPQVAAEALREVGPLVAPKTVVLSIMAGKSLAFLEAALPPAAVVRAMPNTPGAIGRGITVAVGNAVLTPRARKLAHALLSAIGAVEWIDDEALMDAVTAVSGSGPAYVFLLAESLANAGIAAGMPPQLAERLARATVAGAGELLHRSGLSAGALRTNVTSPGGTTAAALDVLMRRNGLEDLMRQAVAAATRRSRELAG